MIKDLFTGSLGKLNNHGGSRIYTTPNTILVPPEYEVDIGEHGDFISCSLDGRLWLFKNKIIALKWNEETGRMEFSASRSFNNNQFIARGIDWILTKTYIIQYNNGKIVVEAHKIKDIQPMENFYSLLPALDGFQIIKGYLIRKPGAEHTDLVYPVNNAGIFLTPNGSEIWGKNSSYAGKITVEKNDSEYKLEVASTYSVDGDITGITFLNDKLYGFQLDGNHKGLCYASQNLNLYFFAYGEWETLSETTGKIYFDVFNKKALALHDKGMEILPDRKKVECNALEQWIAPTKELHYVSNNIIISALSDKVLATNLSLKYYRSLLKADKELSITATAYNSWKLAVGNVSNKLNFNSLNTTPFIEFEPYDIEVELLNVFEHENWGTLGDIYDTVSYPLFATCEYISYYELLNPIVVFCDFAYANEMTEYGALHPEDCVLGIIEPGVKTWPEWFEIEKNYEEQAEKETRNDKGFLLYGVWPYDDSIYYIEREFDKHHTFEEIKCDISYFSISCNTGEYTDKKITLNNKYSIVTDDKRRYFSELKYFHIHGIQDKAGVFYLEYDYNDSNSNVIETFTDGWRRITNSYSGLYIYCGYSKKDNKIICEHGNIKIDFNLTEEQRNLLETYSELVNIYHYYNIYHDNEFAHILIFKNPNITSEIYECDECLFFVFRTKLKTRSKL